MKGLDEGFECETCHGPISGIKWCKCTNCNDFNMCLLCMKGNKHFMHKKSLHVFNDYDPSESVPYCDSCGELFTQEKHKHVYHCAICEDYGLCAHCHNAGMHSKHKTHIEMLELEVYKELLS